MMMQANFVFFPDASRHGPRIFFSQMPHARGPESKTNHAPPRKRMCISGGIVRQRTPCRPVGPDCAKILIGTIGYVWRSPRSPTKQDYGQEKPYQTGLQTKR